MKEKWKIKRTDNPNDYANYPNTYSLNYYSSRGRERNIEIYYPPDSITSLTLNSANISEMPEVKFATMHYLNLNSNNITKSCNSILRFDDSLRLTMGLYLPLPSWKINFVKPYYSRSY